MKQKKQPQVTFPNSHGLPLCFFTEQITATPIFRIKPQQKVEGVHFYKEKHCKTRLLVSWLLAALSGLRAVHGAVLLCVPKETRIPLSFLNMV